MIKQYSNMCTCAVCVVSAVSVGCIVSAVSVGCIVSAVSVGCIVSVMTKFDQLLGQCLAEFFLVN